MIIVSSLLRGPELKLLTSTLMLPAKVSPQLNSRNDKPISVCAYVMLIFFTSRDNMFARDNQLHLRQAQSVIHLLLSPCLTVMNDHACLTPIFH
jgi:hypothetical protein